MSNLKTIEKLGLRIYDNANPHTLVVDAEELETLLQSAQVIYEVENSAGINSWLHIEAIGAKSKAILLYVEPIKKKTKAEAALELLEKLVKDPAYYSSLGAAKAKRILEMKD